MSKTWCYKHIKIYQLRLKWLHCYEATISKIMPHNWRVQLRTRPTVFVLLRALRCPQMTKTWTKNRGIGDWGQRVKGKLLCKRWTEQEERGRTCVEEILFQGQWRNNRDKNRGRKADFTIFLFSVMSANQKVRCIWTAMILLRFKKYEIQQTSWRVTV